MNPKLEALFDEPEKRYLNAEELSVLSQYVSSIPERMKVYQQIRDQEVTLMQPVADALQRQMPELSEAVQERSIQSALLVLRYAAMSMLMDDETFVVQRLDGWLPEMVKAYDMQAAHHKIFELLNQQLAQAFSPQQLSLLKPGLTKAQAMIGSNRETVESVAATLAGLL